MHTVEEVRTILAARVACDPDCPGWAVFEANAGLEIQRCDECKTGLYDEEVAQLPEAQAALAKAQAEEQAAEAEATCTTS